MLVSFSADTARAGQNICLARDGSGRRYVAVDLQVARQGRQHALQFPGQSTEDGDQERLGRFWRINQLGARDVLPDRILILDDLPVRRLDGACFRHGNRGTVRIEEGLIAVLVPEFVVAGYL